MGTHDQTGVLVLLVDAMRWDYLARTRFIRSLGEQGATGRLEEPFGFTPRAAYFRGTDVDPDGFTHMFEWNPESSPFSAARHLAAATAGRPELIKRVREALTCHARTRVSDFAASYISTAAIPLYALPYFNVAERLAPWSAAAAADSLFSRLDAVGHASCVVAWPDTTGLSDRAITAKALATIRSEHRLAFVHLSALDATGHAYGPGARETQRALDVADALVEALVAHCQRTWTATQVILFGDHGMVPVVRTINVLEPLENSGLTFGRDIGYFVDSTGIRFWYFNDHARRVARKLFDNANYGHFLGAEERDRFGIERCSWRNGEDFFLADPGIVLSPNFFGANPPRGMHGYDPACPDNQGAFVYWDSAAPHSPRDAGVVHARRLFATILRACNMPVPDTAPPPVSNEACAVLASPFTASAQAPHEAHVGTDMERIRTTVQAEAPDCEAVVLLGSFGRGEGVVRDSPALAAVNDYDVMVVGGSLRTPRTEIAARLSEDCGADAVDIGFAPQDFVMAPCQMGYDARYGARVLYGAADIVRNWGSAAPAELTDDAAWLGVSNRICGLLEALPCDRTIMDAPRVHGQLLKLGVAVGDAFLMRWGDYHHLGRTRRTRFAILSHAAGVRQHVREAVLTAYDGKLVARRPSAEWCADQAIATMQAAVTELATSLHADGDKADSWFDGAATHAVAGWEQQRTVVCPVTGLLTPPSSRSRAELSGLYKAIWPLFFACGTVAASLAWAEEKSAVTSRWLELIH